MANANKIVFDEPVDDPTAVWTFDGKYLELEAGGALGGIIVTNGNLKLSGDLAIGQIVVVNPTSPDGEPDNGVYLSGVSGWISLIQTLGTQRDHGKIGSGTHDLTIGAWYGRCAPPMSPEEDTGEPVHRDGLQIPNAQRVTIGYFDFANLYPGATNGGIFCQPQKGGGGGENVDPDDPTLIVDVVVEGGRILNPNAAIHLGACTRCGARNSLLIAQRPFRTKETTVDPIDEGNTKHVIEIPPA